MAKTDVTYAYAADIVKSERDPETGDLMVYGKATGPDLDLDGQICDPKWLKTAMPAWMEWGNVREMHGPIAAGVGVQLDEVGDDWYVTARIVDKGAAEKVEKGVYKGYSIGIKNARVVKDVKAPGGRIVGGEIVENSLVDRPCNPTAKMSIAKGVGLSDDGASIEVEDGAEGSPVELQPVELDELPEAHPDEPRVEDALPDAPADPESTVKVVNAVAVSIGADLLRRVGKLVPADVIKAAPAEDISTAQEAIVTIARLIQSEAESLAAGQMCDAGQISCLLRAIDALQWFQCMEAEEPAAAVVAGDSDDLGGSIIELGVSVDKGADSGPETATVDTDLPGLVKSAVTEAVKAHEEELAALRAELAKVMGRPQPGGPVLARPRAVIAEAGERETALADAEKYTQLAKVFASDDPTIAAGYRQLAEAAKLRSLKG